MSVSIRRAWCELAGGHRYALKTASNVNRTTHIQLRCRRCGRVTGWVPIPVRAIETTMVEVPHD